ncbi:MAG: FkbM family methyltransferase [Ardenticatenaceae bacterium]
MFGKLFENLTTLRHNALSDKKELWGALRKIYRTLLKVTPRWTVSKMIGPYGPFKLDRYFAFSNFEKWGARHNKGFQASIEASRGKTCVLDIGAHIGLVSMPMSRVVAAGGRVYAFEPAEVNRGLLMQHLSDNKISNVVVLPYLVGESEEDEVPFFEEEQPSGLPSIVVVKNSDQFRQTSKKQVTLDSVCAEHGILPEVIKIDVEGAELGVLAGGLKIIKQAQPQIYLSVHPKHIAQLGSSLDELRLLIEQMGYDCLTIDGDPVAEFRRDEYLLQPKKMA